MRAIVLLSAFLGYCKAYSTFSIVPSYELPSEHQYSPEIGILSDITENNQGFQGHQYKYGVQGRQNIPEFRTHIQHPQNGISTSYYNRYDNDIGEKFNFNVGKGTYNTKSFPLKYERYTYVAPDGQLYISGYDNKPEKQIPFKAPNTKPTTNQLFTGNTANASMRPSTTSNSNIPRRTNQLGIPSAALASLAGGGLG